MKIAILGAGSAGQGLASHLALKGYDVSLYNRPASKNRFMPILNKRAIDVSGMMKGTARLRKATCDIREAVDDTDVILLTVRSFAHRTVLEACLPYLHKGQLVVVITGYWASLRMRDLITQLEPGVIFAETTLSPLVSERTGPGSVWISGIKSEIKIAAFPATRTDEAIERLCEPLPQLVPGCNVLETNLENFNPVFHSAIALLNLGMLERMPNFAFYHEGVTPRIAHVIDALDQERRALGKAFGLELRAATESLKMYYGATGDSTYAVFKNCQAYKEYRLPNVFDYIREDVPYGLVPQASFSELAGLPCKATKGIIGMWSLVDKIDYWAEGATLQRLGLTGMSVAEIVDLVTTGRI